MTTPEIIRFEQPLGEPVDFLQNNPDVFDEWNDRSRPDFMDIPHQVITAPDWDIRLEITGFKDIISWPEPKVAEYETPIFGELYRYGVILGIDHPNGVFKATYYPSARYSNSLIEELGYMPGEGKLQFVQSEHVEEDIPAEEYANHFGRLEYPQAMGQVNFNHDRLPSDHVIGVLLMPPTITANIARTIASVCRDRLSAVQAADACDSITTDIRDIADYLLKGSGFRNTRAVARAALAKRSLKSIWGLTEAEETLGHEATMETLEGIVQTHLDELIPKIKELREAA